MSKKEFFPPRPAVNPIIYAYELIGVETHKGLLKIGFTDRAAQVRIKEQLGTAAIQHKIVFEESAMKRDGSSFTDRDVHRLLRKKKIPNPEGEWFKCTLNELRHTIHEIKTGEKTEENRVFTFGMRPEQEEAVNKTIAYFKSFKKENRDKTPHFLWNAKMRFGKTFASYQLAKKMGWKKVLVLTFKPAVEDAWKEDLESHVDFKGWQFISQNAAELTGEDVDTKKPLVCFGSFQDFLGRNSTTGGIKAKNEWVHAMHWDCIIFDEYHFGAWRETAKDLFGKDIEAEKEVEEYKKVEKEGLKEEDTVEHLENIIPITTSHYLYLSGTPFRAISSGEFIEEQIFNWTYSDEQRAKENWKGKNNPYASLPRMVMLTYQLPESIRQIALQGEFDGFDLNIFFKAEGEGHKAHFKYEDEVQKWLDLIRGSFTETTVDNLKIGTKKPPLPFSHAPLLKVLNHTFWFLPSVASCYAMSNLLKQRQNKFYHDYAVVVAAGTQAGIGVQALQPVLNAMTDNPLESKTITLSCGKLTTGVSVKPWTGIFMLRNSSSPETYFQAAFRVQTPWVITNPDNKSPNREEILKEECYVFDFAPDRALRQIADYSCRLNVDESNPETKVAEFINFLPVLAYDGSYMEQINAAKVLDMAMSGTTATLLARRWESALLVNVDNNTLARLMANTEAMQALESIEGFRNLNQDIETIINKSEAVKKAKKEANDGELTKKQKQELTEAEKEYKSLRKKIQDKLIKFATRIPVFMYLTDFREQRLKDVITQLEPGLFKKVTGLTVKDFELLVSLDVFNSAHMNQAVFGFKRYEDASLEYTGINKHKGEDVGGYDTVVTRKEFNEIFENLSPWKSKTSQIVSDQFGVVNKWQAMNATLCKIVEEKNLSYLNLQDLQDVAEMSSGEIGDVFSLIGLLSAPEKEMLRIEFSLGNKVLSEKTVYERLRQYWREKKVSKQEWDKWSKKVQVKWEILN
ncbi:DEAD/DEAH box helicase family protein [Aridibaculum aurantiacum]|uniref:DEAD/DEAH box helicase family protein n=1 Tax=Aridibaculum aurantiacum TaxID=2810307 RepID=UPI001A95B8A7|nr:GIY-YIG nuclease family protein [Aridibaculum aurantiacum]